MKYRKQAGIYLVLDSLPAHKTALVHDIRPPPKVS